MSLAILGGTFDPIHFGHLRSAVELRETLGVDSVKLIPSVSPPHRDTPGASADQRLAMVKLAIEGVAGLEVDDVEFHRSGHSYTINTLEILRALQGVQAPMILALGADAFSEFHTWHEWQKIIELSHILIMDRPGYEMTLTPALASWYEKHLMSADMMTGQPAGGIGHLTLTQLSISATSIRHRLQNNLSVDFLLPDAVVEFIKSHHLYGAGC